jgi:hypothetical protein
MNPMLDLVFALILAFIAGLIVKSVDWIDDEKLRSNFSALKIDSDFQYNERKGKYIIKWPLAIVYGVLIGYLISQASFSTIFLAALFAQVFARKIDTHTHVLGFVVALFSLFYFGFPAVEIILFVFFILLAFMDEMRLFGKWKSVHELRPFLKVGAALLIPFGRIDYFLGIMVFDFGYVLFDFAQKRVFRLE